MWGRSRIPLKRDAPMGNGGEFWVMGGAVRGCRGLVSSDLRDGEVAVVRRSMGTGRSADEKVMHQVAKCCTPGRNGRFGRVGEWRTDACPWLLDLRVEW